MNSRSTDLLKQMMQPRVLTTEEQARLDRELEARDRQYREAETARHLLYLYQHFPDVRAVIDSYNSECEADHE